MRASVVRRTASTREWRSGSDDALALSRLALAEPIAPAPPLADDATTPSGPRAVTQTGYVSAHAKRLFARAVTRSTSYGE